jgi:hypothetical protein
MNLGAGRRTSEAGGCEASGSDQDGIVLLPELDQELAARLAGKCS